MNRYYIVVTRYNGGDRREEHLTFIREFDKEDEIFDWLRKLNSEHWPSWIISFYKKIEEQEEQYGSEMQTL